MAETQKVMHVFGELGRLHLGFLWAHMEAEGVHYSMYVLLLLLTVAVDAERSNYMCCVWAVLLPFPSALSRVSGEVCNSSW
jgi:hypothetical protein